MKNVLFLKYVCFIFLVFIPLSTVTSSAKIIEKEEVNRLFTEAVKNIKKADKAKENKEKLELYQAARYRFNDIIELFPEKDLTIKLLAGQMGYRNSLNYLDRRIDWLEKKARKEKRNAAFYLSGKSALKI